MINNVCTVTFNINDLYQSTTNDAVTISYVNIHYTIHNIFLLRNYDFPSNDLKIMNICIKINTKINTKRILMNK